MPVFGLVRYGDKKNNISKITKYIQYIWYHNSYIPFPKRKSPQIGRPAKENIYS